MRHIYDAERRSRHERYAHEAVGDAAMVLKSGDGAFELPEHIHVSGLGGQHHGHGGQRRLAIEAGAAKAGAGQKMGNGIQVVLRVKFELKRAIVRRCNAMNVQSTLIVIVVCIRARL